MSHNYTPAEQGHVFLKICINATFLAGSLNKPLFSCYKVRGMYLIPALLLQVEDRDIHTGGDITFLLSKEFTSTSGELGRWNRATGIIFVYKSLFL